MKVSVAILTTCLLSCWTVKGNEQQSSSQSTLSSAGSQTRGEQGPGFGPRPGFGGPLPFGRQPGFRQPSLGPQFGVRQPGFGPQPFGQRPGLGQPGFGLQPAVGRQPMIGKNKALNFLIMSNSRNITNSITVVLVK